MCLIIKLKRDFHPVFVVVDSTQSICLENDVFLGFVIDFGACHDAGLLENMDDDWIVSRNKEAEKEDGTGGEVYEIVAKMLSFSRRMFKLSSRLVNFRRTRGELS